MASHEYMPAYSRPTIGFGWRLILALMPVNAYIWQNVGYFFCASELVPLYYSRCLNLMKFVAIDILGLPPKSRCGFQYIILKADRFGNLTQMVTLRCTNSVDVAQVLLQHWVYKYRPPKVLLSDVTKQHTSKLLQSECHLHETTNLFTFTYNFQNNE